MSCFQGLEPFGDIAEMLLGCKEFTWRISPPWELPAKAVVGRTTPGSAGAAAAAQSWLFGAQGLRSRHRGREKTTSKTQATWSPAPSRVVLCCWLALNLSFPQGSSVACRSTYVIRYASLCPPVADSGSPLESHDRSHLLPLPPVQPQA